MADIASIWAEVLPELRKGVTGVGVWAALNTAKPVTLEGGTLVIGLDTREAELGGHLKLPQTKRLIEQMIGAKVGQTLTLRVISGTAIEDWEVEKRRDEEKRKLQVLALERAKRETESRTSWEALYEQLSRRYAATPNRSLPQNRAKFLTEAVDLVAQALIETPVTDELAERNYARCIERVAQYSEVPSAIVALMVLERTFKG